MAAGVVINRKTFLEMMQIEILPENKRERERERERESLEWVREIFDVLRKCGTETDQELEIYLAIKSCTKTQVNATSVKTEREINTLVTKGLQELVPLGPKPQLHSRFVLAKPQRGMLILQFFKEDKLIYDIKIGYDSSRY